MVGAERIGAPDAEGREALAWVERLRSGRMTVADSEALRDWRRQSPAHAQALAEASVMMRLVSDVSEGFSSADTVAAAAVSFPYSASRRFFLGGMATAAVAAVGYASVYPPLALWPSLGEIAENLGADYTTGKGEQRKIEIAQVAVEMNTQTGISVLSKQSDPGVQLLHGEASVETKSVPFQVKAGSGNSIARNAKFNVRYDGTSACVSCETGVLHLQHPNGTADLGTGQQITYSATELSRVETTDIAVTTAWRRGVLIFHNKPLSYVVAEVNRYRNGRIVILKDSIEQQRVYANFHIDKVDSIVNQIQRFSNAHVVSLGDVVFLS